MPLIISPKTTGEVIQIFTDVLRLEKVPKSRTRFWHGNFTDSFYEGLDDRVKVLFAGYSGAVVGQALLEYAERYLPEDPDPRVYFVGSVFAFRHSRLELGDLAYAVDTFSPDSFEQAIYANAQARGIQDYRKPDSVLLDNVLRRAEKLGLRLKPTKVYCRISPGFMPDFTSVGQLMGDAMWWKFALGELRHEDFDSGEYESATALATSKLFGMPAVALLDVKDKMISPEDYRIVGSDRKREALREILNIVKESLRQ